MMTILNRFIIKEWYKNFLGSSLTLFLLVSTANLISNFLRRTVTSEEVLRHFLLDIPYWSSKILPLACLIATLFGLNKLKSKNELLSIFTSGLSYNQFYSLILQVSLPIVLIQFLNVSYLIPYTKKVRQVWIPDSGHKFSSTKEKGLSTSIVSTGKIWYKSEDYFFSFKAYDSNKDELDSISLYYFNPEGITEKIIYAEKGVFKGDQTWQFQNGKILSGLANLSFPVEELFKTKLIDLNENLKTIKQIVSDITTLSIVPLFQYIKKIKYSGINVSEYEVLFYDKIISCLLCLIFTFLPISGIYNLNRRQETFGKNVLFTLFFTISYWFIYSFLQALGTNGKLPSLFAVAILPAIFVLFILVNMYRHKKLL